MALQAPTASAGFLGIPFPLFFLLAIVHGCIAGFTIFAATALLRRASWTRYYFAGLLALLAVEAMGFGAYLMAHSDGAEVAALSEAKAVAGIAVILIGCIALMICIKLLKDKQIRAAFHPP